MWAGASAGGWRVVGGGRREEETPKRNEDGKPRKPQTPKPKPPNPNPFFNPYVQTPWKNSRENSMFPWKRTPNCFLRRKVVLRKQRKVWLARGGDLSPSTVVYDQGGGRGDRPQTYIRQICMAHKVIIW